MMAPKNEDSGHGTHVSGSVLGNGYSSVAANNEIIIKGIVYEAKLVFQAIEQWMDWTDKAKLEWKRETGKPPPEFGLFGTPNNISEIFEYAYKKGCRIHSNSWGEANLATMIGSAESSIHLCGNIKILQYYLLRATMELMQIVMVK